MKLLADRQDFFDDGFEMGIEKGRKNGKEEGKIEIAREMLSTMPDEKIAQFTKLPLEKIRALRAEVQ